MSDVAVRKTAAQELVAQVRSDAFVEQITMALPDNVPASRFVRSTVTALLANPDIAKLDGDSVFVALLKAAQDGLVPDGREAAIVGYSGKAQYLSMVGGIRRIAAEYGWTIDAKVVYANDDFEYELGVEPRLTHRPAMGERGDMVFAYAVGRHKDGRREIEVMDAAEIAKVRKVSRASGKGPWVDWPDRMWEKSVAHRIFKRLPLDPSDKRVTRLIADAEALGPEASAAMLYGPSGAPFGQVREITQDSSGKGAVSHAAEEELSSPAPPAGGPDDQAPALAAPSPEPAPVGSQQAAEVVSDEAAASAAPGFPIPQAVVDKAGAMIVQDGWTVESICADASGPSWVKWALDPESDTAGQGVTAAMVDATRLYVGQKHPELLGGAS